MRADDVGGECEKKRRKDVVVVAVRKCWCASMAVTSVL